MRKLRGVRRGALLPPLLLAGAIASVTGRVDAQEARGPGPVRPAVAPSFADHVRRAEQARKAGRWAEAEAAYEAALATADWPATTDIERAAIVGELGLCELELGKFREAAEHLAQSLKHWTSLHPTLRRRFELGRRKAEARVARLYLGVLPPDAEVLLDGRPLGNYGSIRELFVEPGQHTVRARLAGHNEAMNTFEAEAGKAHTITLELRRAPEQPVARSSRAPAPAPAAPVEPSSPGPGPALRVAGVVLTGVTATVGASFLIWGTVSDADMKERSAELYNQSGTWSTCRGRASAPECEELRGGEERRDVLSTAGFVSLAASGAIGVVTLASFWLAQPEPADSRRGIQVSPVITGQQTTLIVRGAW